MHVHHMMQQARSSILPSFSNVDKKKQTTQVKSARPSLYGKLKYPHYFTETAPLGLH